jgi:hypothetical protein
MHSELNKFQNNYTNPFKSLFSKEIGNPNNPNMNSQINYSNKIDSLNYFISFFNKNNNSVITNFFSGIMKTKIVCKACRLLTYTFKDFNYISFNLDSAQKKINQNNQIDIVKLFNIQNDIVLNLKNEQFINCRNCKKISQHVERKQFSSFPRCLIINLDRGSEYHNKMKVNFGLDLNLVNCCDNMNSPINFRLIGIIKRVPREKGQNHYISLYSDFKANSWILRDDSKTNNINNPLTHQQGEVIMLFYVENKIMNQNNINNNFNNNMQIENSNFNNNFVNNMQMFNNNNNGFIPANNNDGFNFSHDRMNNWNYNYQNK